MTLEINYCLSCEMTYNLTNQTLFPITNNWEEEMSQMSLDPQAR